MKVRTLPRGNVVALAQTSIGDYRQEVMDLLCQRWGARFLVYAGDEYFDSSLKTGVDLGNALKRVDNRFLAGRRLLWQRGVVIPLVRAQVAIVEFNPRIISTWVVLLLRRFLKRRTVLWGHAWARKGRESPSEGVRKMMRRLASLTLVYTESQGRELGEVDGPERVLVAPNALYRQSTMGPVEGTNQSEILCVGRLIAAKKPCLLLEAFSLAVSLGLAPDCKLVFIGAGPEEDSLRELLAEKTDRVRERVRLVGHVPSTAVARYFANAILSVSPGYVGLSITQSLSFGVPVIVARDEPHAPEVEAVREGFNAVFTPSNDAPALARLMVDMAERREFWLERRHEIANDCAARYSVEAMAAGFEAAVG